MKKILYVEDNEMNRDMLGRRLTRREYEVIFAFDGQEGLDKMKSENPDLVLMDMGLKTDAQKSLTIFFTYIQQIKKLKKFWV